MLTAHLFALSVTNPSLLTHPDNAAEHDIVLDASARTDVLVTEDDVEAERARRRVSRSRSSKLSLRDVLRGGRSIARARERGASAAAASQSRQAQTERSWSTSTNASATLSPASAYHNSGKVTTSEDDTSRNHSSTTHKEPVSSRESVSLAQHLRARLHYATASCLAELQHGHTLSRCLEMAATHRPTDGVSCSVACASAVEQPDGAHSSRTCDTDHVRDVILDAATSQITTQSGDELLYRAPVEAGRYLFVATVPPALVRGVGAAVVADYLLSTVLLGHDSQTGVYVSLHHRLGRSAPAVQRALRARVRQLARVFALLRPIPSPDAAEVAAAAAAAAAARHASTQEFAAKAVTSTEVHSPSENVNRRGDTDNGASTSWDNDPHATQRSSSEARGASVGSASSSAFAANSATRLRQWQALRRLCQNESVHVDRSHADQDSLEIRSSSCSSEMIGGDVALALQRVLWRATTGSAPVLRGTLTAHSAAQSLYTVVASAMWWGGQPIGCTCEDSFMSECLWRWMRCAALDVFLYAVHNAYPSTNAMPTRRHSRGTYPTHEQRVDAESARGACDGQSVSFVTQSSLALPPVGSAGNAASSSRMVVALGHRTGAVVAAVLQAASGAVWTPEAVPKSHILDGMRELLIQVATPATRTATTSMRNDTSRRDGGSTTGMSSVRALAQTMFALLTNGGGAAGAPPTRRRIALLGPTATALWASVGEMLLMRRVSTTTSAFWCSSSGRGSNRDVVLCQFRRPPRQRVVREEHARNDARYSDLPTACWHRSYWSHVEQLLRVAAVMRQCRQQQQQWQRRRCSDGGSARWLQREQTVMSLMKGGSGHCAVWVHVAAASSPAGGLCYALVSVRVSPGERVRTAELVNLTTWMLAKVV